MLMALSIAGERERGTLEQLLVTKMKVREIIAGKLLAVGAVGLAEAVTLVLVMRWLFQIPIAGSALLLFAILPLLVLAPIGIGLLIAAKARTQSQALQLTQVVFLPSVLLSGFLMPKEFLNVPLGWLSDLLPATYVVGIVRGIVLRGASAADLTPAILLVMGFSLLLAFLGYYCLRRSVAG
jgi:ABC-2 type transport system permease protein